MKKAAASHEKVTELVLLVLDVYGALHANGQKITQPFEQSPARWQLMGQLDQQSWTVSEIARRVGNSRQAVQRLANEMVRDDLIEFVDNLDHRRSPKLKLTGSGASTLRQINLKQHAWAKALGVELTSESVNQTIAGLGQLLAALETTERDFFQSRSSDASLSPNAQM